MPKKPPKMRPDVAEIAYRTMLEATGQAPKTPPPDERPEKNAEAVARGRKGGKKGGPKRAQALSKQQEGERGIALVPIAKDVVVGPYLQHQLARIYILVGEPEKALDQLEPLLKIPYYLSPAWLKIDPTFDPLRGNARFECLIDGPNTN